VTTRAPIVQEQREESRVEEEPEIEVTPVAPKKPMRPMLFKRKSSDTPVIPPTPPPTKPDHKIITKPLVTKPVYNKPVTPAVLPVNDDEDDMPLSKVIQTNDDDEDDDKPLTSFRKESPPKKLKVTPIYITNNSIDSQNCYPKCKYCT
jgi:hypothetical protein